MPTQRIINPTSRLNQLVAGPSNILARLKRGELAIDRITQVTNVVPLASGIPLVPANVTATSTVNNSVRIAWQAVEQSGDISYSIWKATDENGSGTNSLGIASHIPFRLLRGTGQTISAVPNTGCRVTENGGIDIRFFTVGARLGARGQSRPELAVRVPRLTRRESH